MNREEAIKHLETYSTTNGSGQTTQAQHEEAKRMGIKALEQMPVTTTAGEGGVIYYPQVEGVTPTVVDAGKQEPSGDAVDRKLVCAFIAGLISDDGEREKGLEYIRSMPPVNPQPKTGYWIPVYQGDEIIDYRCSECEFGNTFGNGTIGMNFCPVCGAKMVEPQESERTL